MAQEVLRVRGVLNNGLALTEIELKCLISMMNAGEEDLHQDRLL